MLANGMGGLDWAGLPIVAELLGIKDIEALVHRLMTIKVWRPDSDSDNNGSDNNNKDA